MWFGKGGLVIFASVHGIFYAAFRQKLHLSDLSEFAGTLLVLGVNASPIFEFPKHVSILWRLLWTVLSKAIWSFRQDFDEMHRVIPCYGRAKRNQSALYPWSPGKILASWMGSNIRAAP